MPDRVEAPITDHLDHPRRSPIHASDPVDAILSSCGQVVPSFDRLL